MDQTAAMTVEQPRAEPGIPVYNMKLGMWVFLLSEVMFFTALIGAYIILRFAHPDQFAAPDVVLNVPLTAINTFILICSSVTMVKAFAAIQHGDQRGLRFWLVATAALGTVFLSVQVYEYFELVHEGFIPVAEAYAAVGRHSPEAGVIHGGPLYGTTFYIMTGFHGFHVLLGVLALIWISVRAFRGRYTRETSGGVEVMGLYWHFVDLVWIILFTIVYLI